MGQIEGNSENPPTPRLVGGEFNDAVLKNAHFGKENDGGWDNDEQLGAELRGNGGNRGKWTENRLWVMGWRVFCHYVLFVAVAPLAISYWRWSKPAKFPKRCQIAPHWHLVHNEAERCASLHISNGGYSGRGGSVSGEDITSTKRVICLDSHPAETQKCYQQPQKKSVHMCFDVWK